MKKLCFLTLLLLVMAAGCSKDDYLDPNSDITGDFDPLFAQELQKRGYVADAKHITFSEVKDITRLDVSGKGYDSDLDECVYGELTSLRGIEYFESLTKLRCSYNQLTSLDVSIYPALTELWCAFNPLTSLDVGKNPSLKSLWCSANSLTSLDVSKNLSLTLLSCYDNQLTSLDISRNKSLDTLACSYNPLTSLDVSKNPALTLLSCSSNRLTSLDVSKNPALKYLDCSFNPGDGSVFPVTAWFDNNSIPSGFAAGLWTYDGKIVRIDYRKAE